MIKMKFIFKLLGVFTILFLNISCGEVNGEVNNEKVIGVKNITAKEASETVLKNEKNIVIDIRTEDEFKSGHIKGALNIDFYEADFKEKWNALDKNKPYIFYCRSGNRSGKAIPVLEELGFKEVYHIEDGTIGLNYINYPLVIE
jgi:phage shock protein E